MDVGGRTIALRTGRIVDVGASEGDETLLEFMVRAGRIDAGLAEEAARRARAKSITAPAALSSVGVRATEIRSARRAMFLDRLVRGLGQAEQEAGATAFVPDATHAESDEDEDLSMLVLDALERRAGEHDAGLVGERANEIVHFVDGPFLELARKYVSQADTEKPPAVFEILRRSPAAASRIASLVRAGLVLLQPEQHGAPPPKRPKSIAPAPSGGAPRVPIGSTSAEGPRFRDTLRPGTAVAREPVMRLEPGMTALEPHEFADAGELPVIQAYVGPLEDPLDAPERAVAQLEQAQAPGRDRAQAWLAFGRAWLRHCASIDEAARCAREAAAADPANLVALRESTHLCAAMGRVDLARAYARATVHYAADDEARSEGLLDLARLAERDGDVDAALASLEEATKFPIGSTEAWQRLAQLAYARSDVERAVRAAVGAAEAAMPIDPSIARAWAEWALMLAGNAEAASVEARAIERLGRPTVASAILAARARAPFDVATRQRLLLEAAEIAERGGRDDLAFTRALEAHFADPEMDAIFGPLAAYGERALDRGSFAALVEHLAIVSPDDVRREWLDRAADAFERTGTSQAWALELRVRALLAAPTSDEAAAEVRAHAERVKDPSAYADALERLVRSNRIVDPDALGRRLLDLADHCEQVLGSASRALWAVERYHERFPASEIAQRIERLHARVRIGDNLLATAEADLERATEEERPVAERRLAGLLRDLPDARRRAIDLYRQLLAHDPNDASAALGLERLLAIVGEDEELRLLFATRAIDESAGADRDRRMQHWSGLSSLAMERDEALGAAEAWLAADPSSDEAAFRIDLAARTTGDLELRRAAFERRVASAKRDPERAILLVERGLMERTQGDPTSTVAFADQARLLDPACVDALVVLLEELPRLEAAPALEVAQAAREVLGDTPQLLLVAADLAASVGDDVERRALLDARCAIAQDDPSVAQIRVDRAIEDDDPSAILAAAQQALSRGAIVSGTPLVIERALEAIANHDPGDAATVAIHAADRLGESRFAELALRYADQSGLAERRVAAFERWVAWSSGVARCMHLRSLAAVHRESGGRASEARTWLRLLGDDPSADDACERLAEIYAETRDAERLLAVLALRLESARTHEERENRLLHLAAASAIVLEDVDRAEGFLRRLVAESSEPTTAVGRAAAALVQWNLAEQAIDWLLSYAEAAADEPAERLLAHAAYVAEEILHQPARVLEICAGALERFPASTTLLLAFERAALASKALDDAKRVYALVEDRSFGEHARRGFVYRRARFLERAGDKAAALDAYFEAFTLAPNEGVVFNAIDRIATELDRHDRRVDALLVLVEKTSQLDRRMEILRSAASICEHQLRDPGRAFALIFEWWKSTQRSDLLPDVRRLARAIATTDAARADAATAEVLSILTARVDDSWDVDDQLRCLRIIGAIEHEDRADLGSALAAAERGIAIARENTELDRNEAGELACDAAEWLLAVPDGEAARSYLDVAIELAPDLPRIRALAERVAEAPASAAPVARRAERPAAMPPLPQASGGLPDLRARAAALADDPTRASERLELLRELLREEPGSAESYVALVEAARLAGRADVADTAAVIASRFDDSIARPANEQEPALAPDRLVEVARPASDAAALEMLALLWESVLPLQRRTLAHFGVTGADRVHGASSRPLARLAAELLPRFGYEDVPIYVRKECDAPIAVLPTQPVSLLVRSSLEEDPAALRHYLAAALAQSDIDGLFVTGFAPDQGRGMMEAFVAAFGPQDLVKDVSRDAAAVAAELWHVVPQKKQQRLRDAIGARPELFDWDVAVGVVETVGARAALLAGSVGASLDALAAHDPRVAAAGIASPEAFTASVAASPALAALLRQCLGDDLLAARPT